MACFLKARFFRSNRKAKKPLPMFQQAWNNGWKSTRLETTRLETTRLEIDEIATGNRGPIDDLPEPSTKQTARSIHLFGFAKILFAVADPTTLFALMGRD